VDYCSGWLELGGHYTTPCTALAITDERGCTSRLRIIKVRPHHAAPTPITLVDSSTAERLQAGHSGLQMSSRPGAVIPRWLMNFIIQQSPEFLRHLRSASSHKLSVPRTRLPTCSFSNCRCTDLEQSSAAYHICCITSCLLLSLEDILLRTLLPVITVVVPAK